MLSESEALMLLAGGSAIGLAIGMCAGIALCREARTDQLDAARFEGAAQEALRWSAHIARVDRKRAESGLPYVLIPPADPAASVERQG